MVEAFFIGRIVNSLGEAIDGKGDIVSAMNSHSLKIRHRPLLTENRFELFETGILQ